MKPPRFDYYAPQSLDEALALLEKFASDARVLAGGQSLVPLMNMRLASPQEIIDINKVASLDYIEEHDGYLCLGALTRHRTIERSPLVFAALPITVASRHLCRPYSGAQPRHHRWQRGPC